MNSTPNISEIQKCDYLDANLQPARDMLLNCIGDPSKGEDKWCKSSYTKLYDPVAVSSENINIKRSISAGYGIDNNSDDKINNYNSAENGNELVEGFTSKMFITDNGPGKSNIPDDQCPQGYKWCNKTGGCVQVCTNCKYNEGTKSYLFNEADKCFPEGVYDGINNQGDLKCTCGKNNKYCSDNFVNSFTAGGDLFFGSNIKNIGNTIGLKDLFHIQNL